MKIILTDDVVGLGDIGETVTVRPGYARNFLIPRGVAIESQSSNARALAHRMRQIEAKKRRMKGDAETRAKGLGGAVLSFELRTGAHGRVFGSVTSREIVAKLAELGFEIDRRRVLLAEPLKKLGEYPVVVKLHQDVETTVTVNVTGRESTQSEVTGDVDTARRSLETRSAESQESSARDEEDAADADDAAE